MKVGIDKLWFRNTCFPFTWGKPCFQKIATVKTNACTRVSVNYHIFFVALATLCFTIVKRVVHRAKHIHTWWAKWKSMWVWLKKTLWIPAVIQTSGTRELRKGAWFRGLQGTNHTIMFSWYDIIWLQRSVAWPRVTWKGGRGPKFQLHQL